MMETMSRAIPVFLALASIALVGGLLYRILPGVDVDRLRRELNRLVLMVLLPALNPDVALIHVQRCDAYGNAQLDGLQFMDIDMAMAANRVILTTERIVSNDQIRRTPDATRIPFFTVEAVVEAPMGCAPHECYGVYEPFFSSLDDYAERVSKDAVAGCRQYLEEFYHAPRSWSEYLDKLGMDAVLDACRRGRSVHND